MARWSKQNLPRYATGIVAAALSLYSAWAGSADLTILAASVFFLLICITDTLYSRIPNAASATLLLAGFALHGYTTGASGLLFSFLGLFTGFSLFIIPYLMGGIGAGDVKALAALGAVLGAGAVFQVFLYTSIIGGILAIFHYAFNHDLKKKCSKWFSAMKAFTYTRSVESLKPTGCSEQLRFPYAAAITFGFFAYVNWGGLL